MSADPDFYRHILDHLYDGVYFVDRSRRITYWNRGAERITGYSEREVLGRYCGEGLLRHVDESGQLLCGAACPLLRTMYEGSTHEAHVFLHHARGHRVPVQVRAAPMTDEHGRIIGAVETFSDNSSLIAALKRITELDDAAFRDPVTAVGNRRFADAKLRISLAEVQAQVTLGRHRERGLQTGLIFVDLDRFKVVNDRHGHLAGDKVLAMVARTMAANLRTTDFVARWGGEEFLAIVFNVDGQRLLSLAEHLRLLVSTSRLTGVADGPIGVTVSIGATLMRGDDSPESLMERADQLMYRSKQEGRNRVCSDVPQPSCSRDDAAGYPPPVPPPHPSTAVGTAGA